MNERNAYTTCPACSSKAVRHLPGSPSVNACFDCGTEFEVRETWGGPVANVLPQSDPMPTPATPTTTPKPMTNVQTEFLSLLKESLSIYRELHRVQVNAAIEPLIAPGTGPKPDTGPLIAPGTYPTPPPPVKRRTLTPSKGLVTNAVEPLTVPRMTFNSRRG